MLVAPLMVAKPGRQHQQLWVVKARKPVKIMALEVNSRLVCTTYGAGEFEQSRNLSQLIGNKVTILDPRYTPTGGIKMLPITDLKELDLRDMMMIFVIHPNSLSSTKPVTTPPSRKAKRCHWICSTAGQPIGVMITILLRYNTTEDDIVEGFDWLEHDREDLSGEAANTANNAGTFYYVIWNQWQEDEHENVSASDAIFRRIMFIDDEVASTGDFMPVASLLQSSQEIYTTDGDEVISLYISARDLDTRWVMIRKSLNTNG